jgi:hypothetical protein
VGFGDSHRCSGAVGEFCENYGRDGNGASTIPGWTPFVKSGTDVQLPFWIQDTPIARTDYAHMYTAKNRMDQGVGMILKALDAAGRGDETLVIYTADNGAPFAAGKTNFYDSGLGEPLVVSIPGGAAGARTSSVVSLLDIAPTVLDWLGAPQPATMRGRSLLPQLRGDGTPAAPCPRGRALAPRAPHAQVATARDMTAARAAAAARAPPTPLPAAFDKVFASFQCVVHDRSTPCSTLTPARNPFLIQ